jgi:hypothetical protein
MTAYIKYVDPDSDEPDPRYPSGDVLILQS